MKVHVEGDIYITSDERQFCISKQVFTKDKEGNEVEAFQHIGYYTNLHALINALVKRKVAESTATTLRELLEDIKRITADIEAHVLI